MFSLTEQRLPKRVFEMWILLASVYPKVVEVLLSTQALRRKATATSPGLDPLLNDSEIRAFALVLARVTSLNAEHTQEVIRAVQALLLSAATMLLADTPYLSSSSSA
jgi:hypothetical protein